MVRESSESATAGTDPKIPVAIFVESPDIVARQAVLDSVRGELGADFPAKATADGADPETASGVFVNGGDRIARKTGVCAVGTKCSAVELAQAAAVGSNPQRSFRGDVKTSHVSR